MDMTPIQSKITRVNKHCVADSFNKAAKQYNHHATVQHSISAETVRKLEQVLSHKNSQINRNRSDWLLDIGCGTAPNLNKLEKLCNQVLAVDLAHSMLREVDIQGSQSDTTTSAVFLNNSDAEALAVKTNSIDAVYSSMALQWCESPIKALSEINRVLSSKGAAVVAIMLGESFQEMHDAWHAIDKPSRVNMFHKMNIWLDACSQFNWEYSYTKKTYLTHHQSVVDMLKSLKRIGANTKLTSCAVNDTHSLVNHASTSSNQTYMPKQEITQLNAYFKERFQHDNSYPLNYDVLYLTLQKRA